MKSILLFAAAILAAVCFYFFAPLGFMHTSSTLSGIFYGAIITVPLYYAAKPFTDEQEENTFLEKYGSGVVLIVTTLLAYFSYNAIKENRTLDAIVQNGVRTTAILKDGQKKSSRFNRSKIEVCEITVNFKIDGKKVEAKTEISEAEYDTFKGLGQTIEIIYAKNTPVAIFSTMSEPNKSKYAKYPMIAQTAE